MANLVELIKKIAMEAYEASKPAKVVYGTVTSVKPLKVRLTDKLTILNSSLIVPRALTNCEIEMAIDGYWHTITLSNGLKVGDKVIMLRDKGGQRFLIIDRVEDME